MYKFTSLYLVALFCETAEGSAAEWRAVFEIAELFFALQFSSVAESESEGANRTKQAVHTAPGGSKRRQRRTIR